MNLFVRSTSTMEERNPLEPVAFAGGVTDIDVESEIGELGSNSLYKCSREKHLFLISPDVG